MIDFAHTFPADGKEIDDGYLFGMQSLLTILETLIAEEEEFLKNQELPLTS